MKVKGVAFLSRKALIERLHGAEAWQTFAKELAAAEPYFEQPVFPITLIPAPAFLKFTDLLAERFYRGQERAHWELGEKSAEWAYHDGPNARIFQSQTLPELVRALPVTWRGHYDAGQLTSKLEGNAVDVHITDVPISHAFFEYSPMGYISRLIAITSKKTVTSRAIKGFSRGDSECHYVMTMT